MAGQLKPEAGVGISQEKGKEAETETMSQEPGSIEVKARVQPVPGSPARLELGMRTGEAEPGRWGECICGCQDRPRNKKGPGYGGSGMQSRTGFLLTPLRSRKQCLFPAPLQSLRQLTPAAWPTTPELDGFKQ